MMRRRGRSLQARLALRLAALYLAATLAAVGALAYRASDTAGTLDDRELTLRAEDLARDVSTDPAGRLRLTLSPRLGAAYEEASGAEAFAIRDADGRLIAAVPAAFGGDSVARWPAATAEPSYFRLKDPAGGPREYYGLSIAVASVAGPLWVAVAHAGGSDTLVHSLLREFVFDVAWVIAILMVVTLAIGVLAIRNGLRPIREVSRMASAIGPSATSVRLPEDDLPAEVSPLVAAMNRALDRLDKGFAVQRQFTANAAHELRTPLAIITGALDELPGNGEVERLKGDVGRMNRLVEQLLRVARLDAVALDVASAVDLNAIAAEIVAYMAPWALSRGRSLALASAAEHVPIKGNPPAIADALRNLIENAVVFSPAGSEVAITVEQNGRLAVADHGSGIPVADREMVFERFWRRSGAGSGAGLGLAIVREIMRAHQGTVTIAENEGGGTLVVLSFVSDVQRRSLRAPATEPSDQSAV